MPQGYAKHTPAVVDEVIALARAGYSRRIIGERFKISRSSVCGILHRAGVKTSGNKPPSGRSSAEQPPKAKPRPRTVKAESSRRELTPPLPAKSDNLSFLNLPGVTLDELASHHCRWILDTGRYCGDHKREGSYCSRHARLAFQPAYVRQRRAA